MRRVCVWHRSALPILAPSLRTLAANLDEVLPTLPVWLAQPRELAVELERMEAMRGAGGGEGKGGGGENGAENGVDELWAPLRGLMSSVSSFFGGEEESRPGAETGRPDEPRPTAAAAPAAEAEPVADLGPEEAAAALSRVNAAMEAAASRMDKLDAVYQAANSAGMRRRQLGSEAAYRYQAMEGEIFELEDGVAELQGRANQVAARVVQAEQTCGAEKLAKGRDARQLSTFNSVEAGESRRTTGWKTSTNNATEDAFLWKLPL